MNSCGIAVASLHTIIIGLFYLGFSPTVMFKPYIYMWYGNPGSYLLIEQSHWNVKQLYN